MEFFKKTWVIVILVAIVVLFLEWTTGIFSRIWHTVKPGSVSPTATPTAKK